MAPHPDWLAPHPDWLRLVTCVFFGAIAAEGFGPTITDWTQTRIRPEAVWLIVGLVVLHVAAALKHHFVDKDDVLTRMLPQRS